MNLLRSKVVFWTILAAVVLLAILGSWTYDGSKRTLVAYLAFGFFGILCLLGFGFPWARKTVAALIFILYLVYLAYRVGGQLGVFDDPNASAGKSLLALVGFVVIGVPCLRYLLKRSPGEERAPAKADES